MLFLVLSEHQMFTSPPYVLALLTRRVAFIRKDKTNSNSASQNNAIKIEKIVGNAQTPTPFLFNFK